jgi:hypothetical protein
MSNTRKILPDRDPMDPKESNQFVVGAQWPMFQAFFADAWTPGQHVALIGPTGEGKSTFGVGILKTRRFVLALDAKGDDSTLTASGFTRIGDWPPPNSILDRLAEGMPTRLIVGFDIVRMSDFDDLRRLLARVLDEAYASRGWTIYIDELQLMADRKMMNLGPAVEKHLVSARDKKISVVTAYQAPSWVPWAASRQARWIVIWPTRDEDMVRKLATATGRPYKLLLEAVKLLPPFHCLVIPPNFRDPMIITTPPKVS